METFRVSEAFLSLGSLETTAHFHETDLEIFLHAGLTLEIPFADQTDKVLFWKRFTDPLPHSGGMSMICGHTSQKLGIFDDCGHAVCIDTHDYESMIFRGRPL